MIHAARITDRGDVFWFASLDGESWVGVNQDPRPTTEAEIRRILNGNGKWRPMTATRGFLQRWGAEFYDR